MKPKELILKQIEDVAVLRSAPETMSTGNGFKDFYKLNVKRVHRYCLFRTNSYQDAEDITAEVFIKYLNAKRKPSLTDQALPWLFKVASNFCTTHNQRKIKGRLLEQQAAALQESFEQPWKNTETCSDCLAFEKSLSQIDMLMESLIPAAPIMDIQRQDKTQIAKKPQSVSRRSFARLTAVVVLTGLFFAVLVLQGTWDKKQNIVKKNDQRQIISSALAAVKKPGKITYYKISERIESGSIESKEEYCKRSSGLPLIMITRYQNWFGAILKILTGTKLYH